MWCRTVDIVLTFLTRTQEERYRKERAAYLRAKHKQDSQGGAAAGHKRPRGGAAAAGMKDKGGKKLKKPKKPTLAMVSGLLLRMLMMVLSLLVGQAGRCSLDCGKHARTLSPTVGCTTALQHTMHLLCICCVICCDL
jgi:hypothetical protein